MIVEEGSFGLQERAVRKNRLKTVESLVCFLGGLIQFLTAMNLENEGHDVLWQRLRNLFQLNLVSLIDTEHA